MRNQTTINRSAGPTGSADQLDRPDQPPQPLPDVKTQQAQIEELLRHAERAASERRGRGDCSRSCVAAKRRRPSSITPVAQLGESPAAAAAAQVQQSAQIDEIRQQLIRVELRRTEERKQIEELKRRQEQIIQAEQAQSADGKPSSVAGAQPNAMTSAQADAERTRQQAAISELQQKQARWDERRLARAKRIEELVELQKARAAGKEPRAVADRDEADTSPAKQLEIMQQQARRMALGHPDEKPSAAPVVPVKLDTAQPQPQPLTDEQPADGAATNPGKNDLSNAGDAKTGLPPSPGQQGAPASQTPAHEDGTGQGGATKEASGPSASPSGETKTPANAPPDKGNSWRPEIVTDKDRNGPFGGKWDKGWHPEVVTAVMPPDGASNPGTDIKQTPVGGNSPPLSGDEASAPAKPTKAEASPAPAAPETGDQKDDPKSPPAKPAKKDRFNPSRGLPPVMGNIPLPQAEILATNMGPAEFKKARELGLDPVEPTHLRNLGMKLTRLRVPRGANIVALRKKLAEQMPLGGFADNQTYWIFGASRGGDNRSFFSRPRARGAPIRAPSPRVTAAAPQAMLRAARIRAALPAPILWQRPRLSATALALPAAATRPAAPQTAAPQTSSASEKSAGAPEAAADASSGATDSNAAQTGTKENEVAARSDENGPARRVPVPARQSDICKGQQCFASSLIKWHSDLRTCTKDVKVGIIDTSFDISHPTFQRMKGSSGQFLNGEAPSTHDWHGTAVLSLLAGDPASSTPGLIPDASFYLATAFKTDEAGNASTDTMRLLQALDWLDALDVRYINMSFSGPRDPLFEQAINRMAAKGTVFIAAAGNQGPTAPPSYPAAYPQVIAVTAVNKNAENYRHANRGQYVDLSAPGVEIMTALPDGKQGFRTGTSFAAPFVTAIVATRSDPSHAFAGKRELLSRLNLQDLGPPGPDPIYGQGLALAPKVCSGSGGAIAHNENAPRPPKFSAAAAQ